MADIALTGVKRRRDVASEGKGVKLALVSSGHAFLIAFLFQPLMSVLLKAFGADPWSFWNPSPIPMRLPP